MTHIQIYIGSHICSTLYHKYTEYTYVWYTGGIYQCPLTHTIPYMQYGILVAHFDAIIDRHREPYVYVLGYTIAILSRHMYGILLAHSDTYADTHREPYMYYTLP